MRVLICDDNVQFCHFLSQRIESFFEVQKIAITTTLLHTQQEILSLSNTEIEHYTVAFLDVEMGCANGIAVGKKLKEENPSMILVYVSAFLEFATDGYTVNAFRYLLKREIEKNLTPCLKDVLDTLSTQQGYLPVKHYKEILRIPYQDIYYLQSDLRTIRVYGNQPNKEIASFYGKMSDVYSTLPETEFLQPGKSTVVNMCYIKSISNYMVLLKNGVSLSVSRSNYSEVQCKYTDWRGNL